MTQHDLEMLNQQALSNTTVVHPAAYPALVTCPISTGGVTRRVRLVRGEGGGFRGALRAAQGRCCAPRAASGPRSQPSWVRLRALTPVPHRQLMQLMISLVISVTLHVRNEWVIPILISSITNPIMAYSADPSTRMCLLNLRKTCSSLAQY